MISVVSAATARLWLKTLRQVSEIGYGMWGMGGWSGSDDGESAQQLHMREMDLLNERKANLEKHGRWETNAEQEERFNRIGEMEQKRQAEEGAKQESARIEKAVKLAKVKETMLYLI